MDFYSDTPTNCMHSRRSSSMYHLRSKEGVEIDFRSDDSWPPVYWLKVNNIAPTSTVRAVIVCNDKMYKELSLELIDGCFVGIVCKCSEHFAYDLFMGDRKFTPRYQEGTTLNKVELAVSVDGYWLIDEWNGTSNFQLQNPFK